MGARMVADLSDLTGDLERIATQAKPKLGKVVGRNARQGNAIAKRNAKDSSGSHGKNYPGAFSAERKDLLTWEYGPDAEDSGGQGGMSFEGGSRNQPPHNDLARSQDVIGPKFARDVGDEAGSWFW